VKLLAGIEEPVVVDFVGPDPPDYGSAEPHVPWPDVRLQSPLRQRYRPRR
jgi:hypothetical protein